MMFKPAHKEDNPDRKPGQIRNEVTLSDYIERKYPEEVKKKLSFDDWFDLSMYSEYVRSVCKAAWQAGQENK